MAASPAAARGAGRGTTRSASAQGVPGALAHRAPSTGLAAALAAAVAGGAASAGGW
jgi:hypothetical protein